MFTSACARPEPFATVARRQRPHVPGRRGFACAAVRLGLAGLLLAGLSGPTTRLWGQEKSAAKPAATDRAASKEKEKEPEWKPLFDGKTLDNWKVTDFGGQGAVEVQDGSLVLGMGSSLTGITYQKEFPKCDYEIQLEARRLDGVDFFATVTFPVQDSFCSLVVGGWAGAVVGISCLDYADASENETTRYRKFNKEQWYRIRVEVRRHRIRAWIDDESVVDVDITKRKLGTRIEVRRSQPLGIASWETRSALRNIQYRPLPPESEPATKATPEPVPEGKRDSR
jgi:hypothetical protein